MIQPMRLLHSSLGCFSLACHCFRFLWEQFINCSLFLFPFLSPTHFSCVDCNGWHHSLFHPMDATRFGLWASGNLCHRATLALIYSALVTPTNIQFTDTYNNTHNHITYTESEKRSTQSVPLATNRATPSEVKEPPANFTSTNTESKRETCLHPNVHSSLFLFLYFFPFISLRFPGWNLWVLFVT